MPKVRDFWTLDAETTPFHNCADFFCPKCHGEGRVPEPFIWGAYNGHSEEYIEFNDTTEVVAFFESMKTVVYAHNGGRFDYHFLKEHINSDQNLMIIAGRLARFNIGICEFRDSMNIFQQTRLKDFGNKLEIDYALMEPEVRNDPNVRAEISKYLRVDCVDLWNQLYKYFSTYGHGLTQAGTAMKVWSKMSKVAPPEQSKKQFKRYKPFYYGGRVECFRTGVASKNFRVVDMNSAYPKAMMQKHPFSPAGIVDDRLPVGEEKISRALIRLKCVSDGAFPYRTDSGELIFPHDEKFRTYNITGWEFLAALEFDAIRGIEIIEVHNFPISIDFQEYVTKFYNDRQIAKKMEDISGNIFAKLFMNSLYGKFGSNPGGACGGQYSEEGQYIESEDGDNAADGYHEYLIATNESIATHTVEGFKDYKPWGVRRLMLRPLPEVKHHYYNVATAASITGFQRAELFRSMRQCQGLIYTDTDSIAAEDVSNLNIGDALGQWKVELDCVRYGVAGKKNYTYEASDATIKKYHGFDSRESLTGPWKLASKGARLTPHEMMTVASGEPFYCVVCKREHAGICYRPQAPTFSIARDVPKFIDRKITRAA